MKRNDDDEFRIYVSSSCDSLARRKFREDMNRKMNEDFTINSYESSDLVRKPKDCSDLDPKHDTSGVYRIYYTTGRGFKMTTDGGSWTAFIRRMDGSQNFNKKWVEYENAFGDLSREYWLGEKKYAKYSTFKVGDAASKYKLAIGGFSGNAGRKVKNLNHNGIKFTTPDQDNDIWDKNCALWGTKVGSGWWFSACDSVCFTLSYTNNKEGLTGEMLIQWQTWSGSEYSLKYAAMMIRSTIDEKNKI
ncbi:unnamed protein product [Mytilus coruscus]|uniref:Fibrinogen C-terminal domain-containing protein n=1 Tax=Mytilus coruscus TaxID=42192 RepID=A0A6J8D8N6_MYTCO|nr:unnamed protein product [Mytilus coruscus]